MLTAFIAHILDFPTVRVNILDEQSQSTVSSFGCDIAVRVPRDQSVCATVVSAGAALLVEDATRDPRFAALPAVANGQVCAYLGVPLRDVDGAVVGAVCITDTTRRILQHHDLRLLLQVAVLIEEQLGLLLP